jgi:hypothetical protein
MSERSRATMLGTAADVIKPKGQATIAWAEFDTAW